MGTFQWGSRDGPRCSCLPERQDRRLAPQELGEIVPTIDDDPGPRLTVAVGKAFGERLERDIGRRRGGDDERLEGRLEGGLDLCLELGRGQAGFGIDLAELALDALAAPARAPDDVDSVLLLAGPAIFLRMGIVPLGGEKIAAEIFEVLPVAGRPKLRGERHCAGDSATSIRSSTKPRNTGRLAAHPTPARSFSAS